jgi:hypothetical protein
MGTAVGTYPSSRRRLIARVIGRPVSHVTIARVLVLAVSLETVWAVVIAGVPVAGLSIAVGNLLLARANERNRTQPIVIAHEARAAHLREGMFALGWALDAYITSEGGGPAFNVRFGVELGGIRWPYRLREDDPAGSIQRVLRPGERRPVEGSWEVAIPDRGVSGIEGNLDSGRKYWCRYENATGQTWETVNPAERSATLDIKRVRRVGRRQKKEQEAREDAERRGREREQQAVGELRKEAAEEPRPPDQHPPSG